MKRRFGALIVAVLCGASSLLAASRIANSCFITTSASVFCGVPCREDKITSYASYSRGYEGTNGAWMKPCAACCNDGEGCGGPAYETWAEGDDCNEIVPPAKHDEYADW